MKIQKRPLFIFVAIVLVGALVTIVLLRRSSRDDRARDLCSCIFVLDEDATFCANRAGVEASGWKVDPLHRVVDVSGSRSAWIDARTGCGESRAFPQ
ncbi:MAG: hypothetical protein ABIR96_00820 [Bdellovibrionota bacterium]